MTQLIRTLRKRREKLCLTCEAIDRRLGYSGNGSTTRYENFKREMSLRHFVDQANALGLDVWLVPFDHVAQRDDYS